MSHRDVNDTAPTPNNYINPDHSSGQGSEAVARRAPVDDAASRRLVDSDPSKSVLVRQRIATFDRWLDAIRFRLDAVDNHLARLERADLAGLSDPPPSVEVYCDQPGLARDEPVGPRTLVTGWAVSPQGIASIEVAVDGLPLGFLRYGFPRPDVAQYRPLIPDSGLSGFVGQIDLGRFSAGRHTLLVRALTRQGEAAQVSGPIEFDPTYSPATTPPATLPHEYEAWLRQPGLTRHAQHGQDDETPAGASGNQDTVQLYLDLLKSCLTNSIYGATIDHLYDASMRLDGSDLHAPLFAHTMIGLLRLDNLQSCIEDVLRRRVPGDLIETGVWRGGATIFMRAVLKAYDQTDRRVWVADSFAGLPAPSPTDYPNDSGFDFSLQKDLAIPLEAVKANFQRYGLLDTQVSFLKGLFRDTLPTAPIEKLAILRLDGDLYESTIQALDSLYPKLSVGGYLIVDDYGALLPCREAVHDYRAAHGITEEMIRIDWTGMYWRRTQP